MSELKLAIVLAGMVAGVLVAPHIPIEIQEPEAPNVNLNVPEVNADAIWLARAMMSETNRLEEAEYVAWVIRNRVEAQFGGDSTYRDVITAPYQFSAFNTASGRRRYESFDHRSDNTQWRRFFRMAQYILSAPAEMNPLPDVTHFYSPVSMSKVKPIPPWAEGRTPTYTIGNRFRFYADISAQ